MQILFLDESDDDNSLLSSNQTNSTTQTNEDDSIICKQIISFERFKRDPKALHYFTGLDDCDHFTMVLSTLGPAAFGLKYFSDIVPSLTVQDQFLLTLVKLRLYQSDLELSLLFNIDAGHVLSVFITWINFMYLQWSEINMWPSRELVNFHMPPDFKHKYPKTRVILDCIECPIKKPADMSDRKITFSTSKNRNTVKVLVGMTPGGLVSFVSSSTCGGSVSNRQLIEESGIVEKCDPGDEVMICSQVNVEDLFSHRHVTVNMPDVRQRKRKRSELDMAARGVHINRPARLTKRFKILTSPLNSAETDLGCRIIAVCFYLCNFHTRSHSHNI